MEMYRVTLGQLTLAKRCVRGIYYENPNTGNITGYALIETQ